MTHHPTEGPEGPSGGPPAVDLFAVAGPPAETEDPLWDDYGEYAELPVRVYEALLRVIRGEALDDVLGELAGSPVKLSDWDFGLGRGSEVDGLMVKRVFQHARTWALDGDGADEELRQLEAAVGEARRDWWADDFITEALLTEKVRPVVAQHGPDVVLTWLLAPRPAGEAQPPRRRRLPEPDEGHSAASEYRPKGAAFVSVLAGSGVYPGAVIDIVLGLGAAQDGPSWERPRVRHEQDTDDIGPRFVSALRALLDQGIGPDEAIVRAWKELLRVEVRRLDQVVTERAAQVATSSAIGVVALDDSIDSSVRWLVDDLLARGEFALLPASAFSGKTPFALALAAHVATGRSFLGRPVAQGRVLYLTREADHDGVRRWLQRLGFELAELRPHLAVSVHPRIGDLNTKAGASALLAWMAEHGPFALVVVDALSRFVEGQENATETYATLHRHFVSPVQALGPDAPTLLVLDNTSSETATKPRGSTAKLDAADAVWMLRQTKGRRDDDVTQHRLAHGGRVRIMRPRTVDFARVFEGDGSCRFEVPTPEEVAEAEAEEATTRVEQSIEDAVVAALPADSQRSLEAAVRSALGEDDFGREEFRRVLDRLVRDGVIAVVVGARRSKRFELA